MEYQNEKEFYVLMQKKREEIDDLDISENEKNNLYEIVDANVQGFEKSKVHLEINSKLIKALDKMGKPLKKVTIISGTMQKSLPGFEKATSEANMQKFIDSQNPWID